MNIRSLIVKGVAGIRDFVSPRYHPDLHYMRGPGPATARRAVFVQSRQVLPILRGGRR